MEKKCVCKNCEKTEDLVVCDVCRRPVCKSCVRTNNKINNPDYEKEEKDICDYCAEVYWRGF